MGKQIYYSPQLSLRGTQTQMFGFFFFFFTNMILCKEDNWITLQVGIVPNGSSKGGYPYTHHVLLAEQCDMFQLSMYNPALTGFWSVNQKNHIGRGSVNHKYSISQEICTRFCCALLCCGYVIVHNEFTWSIYPYSSGLLCWHWGNR